MCGGTGICAILQVEGGRTAEGFVLFYRLRAGGPLRFFLCFFLTTVFHSGLEGGLPSGGGASEEDDDVTWGAGSDK